MRKRNKRDEIYDFIVSYMKEHGYSPCVREICQGVGLKSTSSIHEHLKKMYDAGMLETDTEDGSPRAIRVPGYKFVKDGENDDT